MGCVEPVESEAPKELAAASAEFNPATGELTVTGPKFSLRWTAPEVLGNEVQDLPSDMWAAGWICWEVICFPSQASADLLSS